MREYLAENPSIKEGIEDYLDDGGQLSFRDNKELEEKRRLERVERRKREVEHERRFETQKQKKKEMRTEEWRINQRGYASFKRSSIVSPQENREYLLEYRKALKKRLEFPGILRDALLRLLYKNPDSSEQEILDTGLRIAKESNIDPSEILPFLRTIIVLYRRRRNAVLSFNPHQPFKDKDALAEYHNVHLPEDIESGAIKGIDKGPFNVFITYEDSQYPKNKGDSGCYLPGINEGSIALIRGNREGEESTRSHEEGHAIHNLVRVAQKEGEGRSHVRKHTFEMLGALRQYKNEILAFFREGDLTGAFFFYRSEPFTSPKSELRKSSARRFAVDYRSFIENLTEEEIIVVREIVLEVMYLLDAVQSQKNLSLEETIGIFEAHPLYNWIKVARRLGVDMIKRKKQYF